MMDNSSKISGMDYGIMGFCVFSGTTSCWRRQVGFRLSLKEIHKPEKLEPSDAGHPWLCQVRGLETPVV